MCCITFIDLPYVEPLLHPRDEAYFVMVNDLSDMLLDSDQYYFIEDYCINVNEDIGL
jgi:hypothetical protein